MMLPRSPKPERLPSPSTVQVLICIVCAKRILADDPVFFVPNVGDTCSMACAKTAAAKHT